MILCDRGRLRGYSKAVDMWGVGIILYVMLFGFNPFEARTRGETHEAILRCKYTFPADTNASAQVKDLISHLLTREYQKRYTVQECLAHPWFNNAASQASAEPLVSSKKSVRERLAEFNAQRSSVRMQRLLRARNRARETSRHVRASGRVAHVPPPRSLPLRLLSCARFAVSPRAQVYEKVKSVHRRLSNAGRSSRTSM